jgi:hypothetical protein
MAKSKKPKRGGSRPGSGRPQKYREPTEVIRVPVSLVPVIKKLLEDYVKKKSNPHSGG